MPRTTACIRCGKPTTNGSRCPSCANGWKPAEHRELYGTRKWRALSKRTIAAHVGRYGWWCPGFGVPAHGSRDLTTDHVVPGSLEGGLQVLCRACNTRKRHADARRGY